MNTLTYPRPSLVHVLLSLLIIGWSIVGTAVAVTAMTLSWNGFSFTCNLIATLLLGSVGFFQYQAIFVGSPRAASCVRPFLMLIVVFHSVVAANILFASFETLNDVPSGFWVGMAYAAILSIVTLILIPQNSQLQSRQAIVRSLAEGEKLDKSPVPGAQVVGILSVVALVGLSAGMIFFMQPPYAQRVSAKEVPLELPPDATDVRYSCGFQGTPCLCDFATSEDAFRAWAIGFQLPPAAGDQQVSALEILKPVSVQRGLGRRENPLGHHNVQVNDGLHFKWAFEDQSLVLVFDRTTKRAYYYRG